MQKGFPLCPLRVPAAPSLVSSIILIPAQITNRTSGGVLCVHSAYINCVMLWYILRQPAVALDVRTLWRLFISSA